MPIQTTKSIHALLAALAIAFSGHSQGQSSYPQRQIRIVTALPPTIDIYVRVLATRFTEQLGQPVVVENRTGGNYVPPMQAVATSAPDGYTLLIYSPAMQIAKQLHPDLAYDPIADYAQVAKIYEAGGGMVLVRPESPFKTLHDLIAGARAAPGKLSFGGQIGGTGQLNSVSLLAVNGAQGFHVPYKAPGDDIPALARGDIDFSVMSMTLAMPQVKAGKFRVLGVSTANRLRALPDVPTIFETFKNNLLIQESWAGLAAPAKTPPELVARLHAQTVQALSHATLRNVILATGNEPAVNEQPAQYAAFVRREFEKWGEIVRFSGAKAN